MYNHRTLIRLIYVSSLVVVIASTAAVMLLIKSKIYVYDRPVITVAGNDETVTPFPVSVNPAAGVILDTGSINVFPSNGLADNTETRTWWEKIIAVFSEKGWYQNLASPVSRIVVIWPGERKEEAATHIGNILGWNLEERTRFIELITEKNPVLEEGKFYPGQYVTHRDASPEEMADVILTQFENEILNRYTPDVAAQVPFEDAMIIASLLEREAGNFENMREVAGVIWNRLFIGMPLQLDATLQYARANQTTAKDWWLAPVPSDKYINSPYNTYSNAGLPPGPIANPSSDAVLAALNPIPTDCLYYFHSNNGSYHCSNTYEEHVAKLKTTFGRGR